MKKRIGFLVILAAMVATVSVGGVFVRQDRYITGESDFRGKIEINGEEMTRSATELNTIGATGTVTNDPACDDIYMTGTTNLSCEFHCPSTANTNESQGKLILGTSPTASNLLATGAFYDVVLFRAKDSQNNNTEYVYLRIYVDDPTDESEDGAVELWAQVAGTATKVLDVSAGGFDLSGILTDVGGGSYEVADGDNDLGVAGVLEALGNVHVGTNAAGADVTFESDTLDDKFLWDASEACLDIMGTAAANALRVLDGNVAITDDLDVDGTCNLDATDIDGALQVDEAVTVGTNAAGHDVTFESATLDDKFLWDASEECLDITGTAAANALRVLDGNVDIADDLAVDGTANLDNTDIDGTLNVDGGLTDIGGCDDDLSGGDDDVGIAGTLEVDGAARLDSTLYIGGTVTLTNGTTIVQTDTDTTTITESEVNIVGKLQDDGKNVVVGPSTTTLMLDSGSFTMDGVAKTQAFATVFGAAPDVVVSWGSQPDALTNALWGAAATTTNLVVGSDAVNSGVTVKWTAVGNGP